MRETPHRKAPEGQVFSKFRRRDRRKPGASLILFLDCVELR